MSEDNLILMCCCERDDKSSSSSSSSGAAPSSSSGGEGGGGGESYDYLITETPFYPDPNYNVPLISSDPFGGKDTYYAPPPIGLEWIWFNPGFGRWVITDTAPGVEPPGVTALQGTPGDTPVGDYIIGADHAYTIHTSPIMPPGSSSGA